MSSELRTPRGGRIDRTRALRFTFDGREYRGVQGDTLASALIASGVHLVGRSFKYHRPRGFLTAGAEDPNALVTVVRDAARSTPNLQATEVELYDGLIAHSQNRWPSLSFDLGRVNDCLGRFIPAGFYYKTFMWPRGAWRSLYEPRIRAAAGLGRAPAEADPDHYSHRYAHCDVLVVGAGPAGLNAAVTAARAGLSVILCERQAECGGSLLADRSARIDGGAADAWCERSLRELAGLPRVTVLTRTTAFGYFAHNMIGLAERITDHLARPAEHLPRERLWQVRAREVILATGALERPLVFPGNDRPGVMLADAARTYLNRYGVLAGSRVVLLTAHDAAYRAAIDLHAAGLHVAAIADTRAAAAGPLPQAARELGLPVQAGATVLGTHGGRRVRAVTLARLDDAGALVSRSKQTIPCDLLLMSGGFTPDVHLFSQSRGRLAWQEDLQAFVPAAPAERTHSAGACRGVPGLASALEDGAAAAMHAARSLGKSVGTLEVPRVECDASRPEGLIGAVAGPRGRGSGKAFVDWQNDVTVSDLLLAVREGFRSIEHVKRYTTTGMATDQGKTSNLNALGIVARELKRAAPEVGLTTFRMPCTPVTFGTLAVHARGHFFDPVRRTPLHDWAAARGAMFEDVGQWKRALHFPRPLERSSQAIARECRAVRTACGVLDASTLGKIEVVGPDAAQLLDRLYVNDLAALGVGRCRYGILLRDDGYVFDDGVIARLSADRFHVTTTTSGAARVLALMEDYRQTEWPELRVWLTSTTEQWAVIALQGPKAREVLLPHVEGIDLSPGALPHMSLARGCIFGAPLLLVRVSFTGELGFELNIPADQAADVCESLCAAGEPLGLTPYGTDAMHQLRAEKGYIIVGQDADGTVCPEDLGIGWAVSRKKPDFLGKRALELPAFRNPLRKQLVGLLTADATTLLEEGAQVAEQAGRRRPQPVIGHVTSSYPSEAAGRPIALALVSRGRSRMGERLWVLMNGREVAVQVTSPVFYDPEGRRLHV